MYICLQANVSVEGPATKISRRQAIIKLKHTAEFHLANQVRVQ